MKENTTNASQATLVPTGYVPMGTVVPFLLSTDNIPAGWLLCDGRQIPAQYQELSLMLNGYTPNLSGRTLIGSGTGTDTNGNSQTWQLNQTGGEYQNVLTETQIPSHQHFGWGEHGDDNWANGSGDIGYSNDYIFTGSNKTDGDNRLFGSTFACGDYTGKTTVGTTNGSIAGAAKGNTLPHNNMQPYYVVNYIIYTGVNG